jgi:nitroreductase
MIVSWLKQSKVILFFRILLDRIAETIFCAKYIANSNRGNDVKKFQTDMLINAHSLEKGMSIGGVKVGFGKSKSLSLIDDLCHYMSIGGSSQFAERICSIISSYIEFNEKLGADISDVRKSLNKCAGKYGLSFSPEGGIMVLSNREIENSLNSSFDIFSQSRYSVRDFGTTPLNIDFVKKALKLCERTPSACNRQPWKIHVYTGKKERDMLFSMQGGCKGFIDDMQCGILICGDISYYNINEIHQVYVDGGLYAMNLLYALHHYGLATIPLTMGHKTNKITQIKKVMDIDSKEVPVLLIGVGTPKEDMYKVAVSCRNDYNEYTTFE